MVQRTIVLPVPAEELWHALTDPEEVAGWLGPVDWVLAPGGAARFEDEDGTVRSGRVLEVEPARRLRFAWWRRGDEGDASEVTYDLGPDPDGAGTRLVVTEQPFGPEQAEVVPVARASSGSWSAWDGRLLHVWASARPLVGTRR